MKYSVSAETSRRIYKNWIIEATSEDEALQAFRNKINVSPKTRLTRLKIEEMNPNNPQTNHNITLNIFEK